MNSIGLICVLAASACLVIGCASPPHRRHVGITSPEVHPDRRVTFRFRAAKAKKVFVRGAFLPRAQPMVKDDDGIWTFTTAPVAPDIYSYTFSVDGTRVIDPVNPHVKVWRSLDSMVEVPADPPAPHDLQDVPRGTLHRHWYRSESLGITREVVVYTPPGHSAAGGKTYPMLLLLHGSGDNPSTWTDVGKAHRIADNLLAAGKIRPMVIVMPNGHVSVESAEGESHLSHRTRVTEALQADILNEVMPLVAGNYAVTGDPAKRAVVGLSMGGGQSMDMGVAHSDTFKWVGLFSAACGRHNLETHFAPFLAEIDKHGRSPLKLFWVGCGKRDFLLDENEALHAFLTAKGIPHTYHLTDGGHSWRLWRRYLAELLPLLFADGKATDVVNP